MRPFLLDVALHTTGTVQGGGYDVVPQRARLVAWWDGVGYRVGCPTRLPDRLSFRDGVRDAVQVCGAGRWGRYDGGTP